MNTERMLNYRPVGDIDRTTAETIAKFLNHTLANEYALFTKTLNYHWNITGPRFHSIHNFLEGQYKNQLKVMDDIAERVRVLDETPISTVSKMSETHDILEVNGQNLSSNDMLLDLFGTNLKIQDNMKNFIKENGEILKEDPVTEDFIIGLLGDHEKVSWMLKSHLKN